MHPNNNPFEKLCNGYVHWFEVKMDNITALPPG